MSVFWVIRSLLFLAIALPTCIYAWRAGGGPERITAMMVLTSIAATTLFARGTYINVVGPLLAIDLALLAGITTVALLADRYWPLYFAAAHLLTVAVHGVRAYDAMILPKVYARLGGELAYVTLLALLIGTWRHVRRKPEADWSWQSLP